jgi:WD40 repeat protein
MVNFENKIDDFKNALLQGAMHQFSVEDQHTLLIKGILYTIKENPTSEYMDILGETVLNSAYPDIVSLCLNALSDLGASGNQDALEMLFNLAIENQHAQAARLLIKPGINSVYPWKFILFTLLYNSSHLTVQADLLTLITEGYRLSMPDTRERILKAMEALPIKNLIPILTALINFNESSLETLKKMFPALSKEEKHLVYKLLGEQIADHQPLISDIICSLYIFYEDEQALNLALSNQISPDDPIQKAVFFFLSGQWDLYQKLDFNRSLISAAFEKSDEGVRKRLLMVSRESGINDWLVTLSQRSQSRWLNDMTTQDWMQTIRSCQANQMWPELWKLCLEAPPYWSHQILQSLAISGWQPGEDSDFYQTLLSLSQDITPSLEIRKGKILSSPGKSITSIAYHSATHRLAAGTKDQDILFWDIENTPLSLPPLQGPVALSRIIAFDAAGEHLVAANIDNAIRIYKLPEGKLIKTLSGHSNLVRSIALHPDGRTLFSADFDGRIITWRFPFGTEINRSQSCKGEIYSLAVSSSGQMLFSSGSCGHLHDWDWNKCKEIKKLSTGPTTITGLAVSQNSPIVVFYGSNYKITIWNYETEKILNEFEYPPAPPLFTALHLLSSAKFFLIGTNSGEVNLHNIETGTVIASGNVAGEHTTITSLAVGPGDNTCYSSTSDGKIYIWDLQPILCLFIPIKSLTAQQSEIIQEKMKTSTQLNEKKWLELTQTLFQWHRRYDIHISENRPISVGEFDIFI